MCFVLPGNDLQPLYINMKKKKKSCSGTAATHRTALLALRCIQPPVHQTGNRFACASEGTPLTGAEGTAAAAGSHSPARSCKHKWVTFFFFFFLRPQLWPLLPTSCFHRNAPTGWMEESIQLWMTVEIHYIFSHWTLVGAHHCHLLNITCRLNTVPDTWCTRANATKMDPVHRLFGKFKLWTGTISGAQLPLRSPRSCTGRREISLKISPALNH